MISLRQFLDRKRVTKKKCHLFLQLKKNQQKVLNLNPKDILFHQTTQIKTVSYFLQIISDQTEHTNSNIIDKKIKTYLGRDHH